MPIKNNGDALMKKNMQIALCCLVLCIFCNYVYAKPPVAVKITKGDARITALEGSSHAKCSGQKYAGSLMFAKLSVVKVDLKFPVKMQLPVFAALFIE